MSDSGPIYERAYQKIKDDLFLLVVQAKITADEGALRLEALERAHHDAASLPAVNDPGWVVTSAQRTIINTTGWSERDVQLLNDIADLIAKR